MDDVKVENPNVGAEATKRLPATGSGDHPPDWREPGRSGITQAQKRGPSGRSWTYSGDGQQELRPQGERLTGRSWSFW